MIRSSLPNTSSAAARAIATLSSGLTSYGVYSAFSKGLQNTTLSGYVTARAGWGKKKIEIPEMPLDQMARQFGFDPAELLKNM